MKTFLASVGRAQLLVRRNEGLVHLADARTLTDSSLSFSTSMEEVRAGQGAKLHGRFSHTSGLSIDLTDVMFDIDYLAAILGAPQNSNATGWYRDKDFTIDENGVLTLSKTPALLGSVCGLDYAPIWVSSREDACSEEDWELIYPDFFGNYVWTGDVEDRLCVKYFASIPQASSIIVPAAFAPKELVLILTTSLYAGTAQDTSSGRPVGEVTIKIPRFQLNGALDLSSAMASNTPIQLAGVALADSTLSCPTDQDGTYGEIIDVVYSDKWYNGLYDIVLDPETEQLYGEYRDGHYSVLSPDLEGIGAYYNGDTLVLYSVNIPGYNELFSVNPSPDLEYDENNVLIGPRGFSYAGVNIKEGAVSTVSQRLPPFRGNRNIIKLYFPSTLTHVSGGSSYLEGSFAGCTSLDTVCFANGVNDLSIGQNAFYNCGALTSLTLPENLVSIGQNAFHGCSALTSVALPENLVSVGQSAFSGCHGVAEISLFLSGFNQTFYSMWGSVQPPFEKVVIKGGAVLPNDIFRNCGNLKEVVLPNSLQNIGSSAFSHCTSLTGITIPDSVTSIGVYAFDGCTALTSVIIPDSVTRIGGPAFEGCSSLVSIELPFTGTSPATAVTDSRPFYRVFGTSVADIPTSLKMVKLTGGGIIVEQAFYKCTSLASVELPDSVASIGNLTFAYCSSLTSITIPGSLKSIGVLAFKDCFALTSITIPDGVTSIGDDAFDGCESLVTVFCLPRIPPVLGAAAFIGDDDCFFYVPYSSDHSILNAYKTATNWVTYADRILELPEDYQ